MIESGARTPLFHTAGLAAVACVALFVACDTPAPVESDPETGADAAGSVVPSEEGAETGARDESSRPDAPEENSAGLWMAPDGEAGSAMTRLPPPPEGGSVADRPAYIPREVDPKLKNASEIERMLERRYPSALRDAGISGRAVVWLLVGPTGDVEQVRLARSSGLEALDRAAMDVARSMEFEPARDVDGPLGVWISQPVSFRADPGASTGTLQERADPPPAPTDADNRGAAELREIPADTIEGRIRVGEASPTRKLRIEDDRGGDPVEIPEDDAGESNSLQLRGVTFSKAGVGPITPLIIVDGVVQEDDAALSDLNTLDIASIEVVKGPAAERLYGELAADGVIHITTKDEASGGS